MSLFALAGLPPFNGFWSKLFLFMGQSQGGMAWLAAIALINSAVALGYYSYLAKRMFFDDPATPGTPIQHPDVLAVALFAMVFIIVTGLYPEPLIRLISLVTGVAREVFDDELFQLFQARRGLDASEHPKGRPAVLFGCPDDLLYPLLPLQLEEVDEFTGLLDVRQVVPELVRHAQLHAEIAHPGREVTLAGKGCPHVGRGPEE